MHLIHIVVCERGKTSESNYISGGNNEEPVGVVKAREAASQLDSPGRLPGILASAARRGAEGADDAATADAAVHVAAPSGFALPLQPDREVADAQ